MPKINISHKNTAMTKILIDSDVVLDVFLKQEPFCETSKNVFLKIEQGYCDAWISALALANIYYKTRKTLGRETALNAIFKLLETEGLEILGIAGSAIYEALSSDMTDFEDAIQTSAAGTEGIEYVVRVYLENKTLKIQTFCNLSR